MNKTMIAAVQEAPEKLVIKEVPVPTIRDDEVLIRVKFTGICGTDWAIYTGLYSADQLPMIPGHEFSGAIAQVGKGVRGLSEGDLVTADINMSCGHCFYCQRGQKLMCPEFTQLGIHTDGTYAEYVKAPASLVHKLPENLDLMTGAFIEPVSCVIHSAKALDVQLGSSVAIIGSGLGILHAAVAVHKGAAPVIVVGRNKKRLEAARQMGADITIDVDETEDPVAVVKQLTGGRGADYVIEAVGKPSTYEQALEMVRPGGTMAAFGITGLHDTIQVRPFDLVLGEKSIVGSCAGVGQDWNDAIALLQYGRIKPEVLFSKIVPVKGLEAALKELRSNRDYTKVFVSPDVTEPVTL
jgi:L-iditol 2-dehydrogenase